MRPPPPLQQAQRYPVVGALGAAAAAATVAWWCKWDIEPLVMSARFWRGQPWRLVTSTLPHVNIIHLAFNLYWLWVFGSLVEGTFGHLRAAAILLLFGAGASAAEYAFLHGGVGLSGVGYGLFGLLWVLGRRDERFRDAVDGSTIRLFVLWFVICVVLTVSNIAPIGNVAHAAGAVLGLVLGYAITTRSACRLACSSACLILPVLFVVLAGPGRPYVNFVGAAARDLAQEGVEALQAGDNERGERLLQRAVAIDSKDAVSWYNLGVARTRLGRTDEAAIAYDRACALNPSEPGLCQKLATWKLRAAWQAQAAGRLPDALRTYQEALALDRKNALTWHNLALCYEQAGRIAEAVHAQEQAIEIDRKPAMLQELERLRALQPQR
jgi:membrane associated rhomboid family serine protease/Tfp pilus assembly protein PilF